MNTDEEIQSFADNLFKKCFGWKARTENSLFATGNYIHASLYGNHHIVYPFDGYKYIWSNNIRDFYNHLMKYLSNELGLNDDYPPIVYEFYMNNKKIIDDYIKQMITLYRTNNLIQAIDSGNEIMFHCKKYIVISREVYNRIFK